MAFFEKRNENDYSQMHMECQGYLNNQNNIEGEKPSWETDTAGLQDLLQRNRNQDSTILVKEETTRSVEQKRQPRKNSINIFN